MRLDITINTNGHALDGFLELPGGSGPHSVVLMVHGSGGTDVRSWRSDLGYHTIFLRAGVAVMAWDKPGCGRNPGAFDSNQLWRERADEVIAGLAVARAHPAIDRARVGCFGISQGGWVVPMAIVRDPAIAFAVLLSGPAHGGLSQGRYLVRENLLRAGETAAYADAVVRALGRAEALARSGAAPAAVAASLGPLLAHPVVGCFVRWVGEENALPDCWDHPNQAIDAGALLTHVHCPVFAGFGELDSQVDWRESVSTYRTALAAAGNAEVAIRSYPGADHCLLRSQTGSMEEMGRLWGEGRAVIDPAFAADLTAWLVSHGFASD